MDTGQSPEASPPAPGQSGQFEQQTPVTNGPFAADMPTQPGQYQHDDAPTANSNADTQPMGSEHPPLQAEWPLERPARQRSATLGMGFCLGIATAGIAGIVLILVVAAGALYVTHGGDLTSLTGPNGIGELASTPSSTVATPTPTAKPHATHSASVPTAPTPQTQPASPGGHATATPRSKSSPAPQLDVSPRQASGNCLLGQYPGLTVKNSGGGQLTWSASTSDTLVHATPSSGTLSAGQTKSVSLSGIHVGKTLTVTFSGNGGGATITITCG